MAYPTNVNVYVDDFGVADGQDMVYISASNPPAYEKDAGDVTAYQYCVLRRTTDGTNWELAVLHQDQSFVGYRDPAADDPTGAFKDSGTQTATVTDIS